MDDRPCIGQSVDGPGGHPEVAYLMALVRLITYDKKARTADYKFSRHEGHQMGQKEK